MQSVDGARKLLLQGAVRVGASRTQQAQLSRVPTNGFQTTARRLVRERPPATASSTSFSRPEDERWIRPPGMRPRPYPAHPSQAHDKAPAGMPPALHSSSHITPKQDIVYPRGITRPNHRAMNYVITSLGKRGDAEALIECVRKQERGGGKRADALDFCPVNCANWLNKWSKLPIEFLIGEPVPEVTQVLGRALYLLQRDPLIFHAREVSNMASAVAKLQHVPPQGEKEALQRVLLKKLLQWPLRHGWDKWLPMHVAGLLSAVHHSKVRVDEEWLSCVVSRSLEMGLVMFKCQELGVLAHSLGTLRYEGAKDLLKGVAAECVSKGLRHFTVQGLCNLLCGYVNMRLPPGDALLDAVAVEVEGRGEEAFDQRGAKRLVTLLRKLGREPGEVLTRAAAKMPSPRDRGQVGGAGKEEGEDKGPR